MDFTFAVSRDVQSLVLQKKELEKHTEKIGVLTEFTECWAP